MQAIEVVSTASNKHRINNMELISYSIRVRTKVHVWLAESFLRKLGNSGILRRRLLKKKYCHASTRTHTGITI